MRSNGRLFRVQLVSDMSEDGGSAAWPLGSGIFGIPGLDKHAVDLDGRPGVEIMVAVHASCCGVFYRAVTFAGGVLRTMGTRMPGDKMVSVDWLGTFSTVGVGHTFHCVRPGVLGVYGYSSDEKAGVYHATETLYVPHGVVWQRWKESNYTVGINAPDAPLGKRGRVSTCR